MESKKKKKKCLYTWVPCPCCDSDLTGKKNCFGSWHGHSASLWSRCRWESLQPGGTTLHSNQTTGKEVQDKHVIIKTQSSMFSWRWTGAETMVSTLFYDTTGKKKKTLLKSHSQGPGGRWSESMGDGINNSGQVVLQCYISHIVGQVEASVCPVGEKRVSLSNWTQLYNPYYINFRYSERQITMPSNRSSLPCDCTDCQLRGRLRFVH